MRSHVPVDLHTARLRPGAPAPAEACGTAMSLAQMGPLHPTPHTGLEHTRALPCSPALFVARWLW